MTRTYRSSKEAKRAYYNGRWYRSNMEARVAEALDDAGIAWEYERYVFRDKRFQYGQYTPDFYLPKSDAYVEVCATLDDYHTAKVGVLCEILGATDAKVARVLAVLSDGIPHLCWVEGGKLRHRQVALVDRRGKPMKRLW